MAELQRISAAAQEAEQRAKFEQQRREEMEREYNQNLAKIQQQMNQREQEHLLALQNKQETLNAMVEAKKLADNMAAENQRLLQAEKIKNRQDPFLPSSSAANAATCTQRFTKNKSPPKQKEHPLHRGLAQCQLHLPATNAGLAANPPLAPLSGGFRPAPSKIPKTEVLRRINGAENRNGLVWNRLRHVGPPPTDGRGRHESSPTSQTLLIWITTGLRASYC